MAKPKVDEQGMKKTKRIALEFSDKADYRKALALLDEAEGRWALPGAQAIIIDDADLQLFKDAGLAFEEVPVIPASQVPPEERARLRREAHGIRRRS